MITNTVITGKEKKFMIGMSYMAVLLCLTALVFFVGITAALIIAFRKGS